MPDKAFRRFVVEQDALVDGDFQGAHASEAPVTDAVPRDFLEEPLHEVHPRARHRRVANVDARVLFDDALLRTRGKAGFAAPARLVAEPREPGRAVAVRPSLHCHLRNAQFQGGLRFREALRAGQNDARPEHAPDLCCLRARLLEQRLALGLVQMEFQ